MPPLAPRRPCSDQLLHGSSVSRSIPLKELPFRVCQNFCQCLSNLTLIYLISLLCFPRLARLFGLVGLQETNTALDLAIKTSQAKTNSVQLTGPSRPRLVHAGDLCHD